MSKDVSTKAFTIRGAISMRRALDARIKSGRDAQRRRAITGLGALPLIRHARA